MNNTPTKQGEQKSLVKYSHPVLEVLEKDGNKKRLVSILGEKKAELFIASLMSVVNDDTLLKKADPRSIISAAMIAATLNLPITPNLGFAYILPYGSQAQFQMGYKGFIQLASRSGQVAKINVATLSKEQFISYDPITEELKYDLTKPDGTPYVYVGYLELINGFKKYLVMNKSELDHHAKTYSKSYQSKGKSSIWGTNFDAMAKKTVIKKLLNTFAPLDTEMQMQQAITYDQAIITQDGTPDYIDNPNKKNIIDAEPIIKNEKDTKINPATLENNFDINSQEDEIDVTPELIQKAAEYYNK